MHEKTAGSSGPGVEVFVRAPDRCVNVPGVEGEWNISDGVSEVPDDKNAVGMREFGDGGDIEELPGVILDSGEKKERGC